MKSRKQKTSFEHVAELWDAKIGDTLARKPLSSKSGSMKVSVDAVVGMIPSFKGKRFYEIACGNGFLSRYLIERGAREMYASDVSKKLIHLAQTNYPSKGISYSVRSATDFTGLPQNYFDAVIIHQGIFYIDDLDALMKGINHILKKGGALIFTLIHPLHAITRADMGELSDLKEVVGKYKKYLKNYLVKVEKDWQVGDTQEKAIYWQYKRPLSTYVNTSGKHHLLISEICEPATRVRSSGKTQRSTIPSSLIVKAIKI